MAASKTKKRPSRAKNADCEAESGPWIEEVSGTEDIPSKYRCPFTVESRLTESMVGCDSDRFDWCSSEARVAREALLAGFKVSFACRLEHVAVALAYAQRALAIPVCAGFQKDARRVVLWRVPVDEHDELAPITRENCPRCGCYGCDFEGE